jgi:hypothetical protein
MRVKHDDKREPPRRPEDLSRLSLERANAGDVDGLVARYEPTAILALPTGAVARGEDAIRESHIRIRTSSWMPAVAASGDPFITPARRPVTGTRAGRRCSRDVAGS